MKLNKNPELVVFLVGLVLFGAGLSLWQLPAGPIGVGAVLIAASVFGPKAGGAAE